MNVKEFSEAVGVSAHTIRYYDKLGLLGDVGRRSNGHRCFTGKDVEWIAFIQRLKNTGMPIARILDYAQLRSEGDVTLPERLQLLREHTRVLEEAIARQQRHREALAEKLAWYEQRILNADS